MEKSINLNYTYFYNRHKDAIKVYPTEFVVRTFLANYDGLIKDFKLGGKILDLGFGDGRNTAFLIEQGYQVFGTEITQEIVDLVNERIQKLGLPRADLRVGRNSKLPFEDNFFDVLLGCHVSYYCDEGETFENNLNEFSRILNSGGWLVTSLAKKESYILKNAEQSKENGHYIIKNDPYKNRKGYKFRAFASKEEVLTTFEKNFQHISIGSAENNYFGIDERVYWFVGQKK